MAKFTAMAPLPVPTSAMTNALVSIPMRAMNKVCSTMFSVSGRGTITEGVTMTLMP